MPYPRQKSNTWFLKSRAYRIFMLREISSVFIALYAALFLVLVLKVHDGAGAFASFVGTLRNPLLIAFAAIVLLFSLLHTVTWFQAVPKALPLRRGEERIPPALLIGGNYVALLAVTAVILIIVLV